MIMFLQMNLITGYLLRREFQMSYHKDVMTFEPLEWLADAKYHSENSEIELKTNNMVKGVFNP